MSGMTGRGAATGSKMARAVGVGGAVTRRVCRVRSSRIMRLAFVHSALGRAAEHTHDEARGLRTTWGRLTKNLRHPEENTDSVVGPDSETPALSQVSTWSGRSEEGVAVRAQALLTVRSVISMKDSVST